MIHQKWKNFHERQPPKAPSVEKLVQKIGTASYYNVIEATK
jgi:hypothetical protein